MRFNDNVETCDTCMREISESDNMGFEDNNLCPGCWSRDMQKHVKTPCKICKEQLGEKPYHYNPETDALAHSECVEDSPLEEQEEWSNDFW